AETVAIQHVEMIASRFVREPRRHPGMIPEQERALALITEEAAPLDARQPVAVDAEGLLIIAAQRRGATQRSALVDLEDALRAEAPRADEAYVQAGGRRERPVPLGARLREARARRGLRRRAQCLGLEHLGARESEPRPAA